MASSCTRFFQRSSSLSTFKSALYKPPASSVSSLNSSSTRPSLLPSKSVPSLPGRCFSLARSRVELGGVASILPLHSAVAQARMTSCLTSSPRSCRALSQDKTDGT